MKEGMEHLGTREKNDLQIRMVIYGLQKKKNLQIRARAYQGDICRTRK